MKVKSLTSYDKVCEQLDRYGVTGWSRADKGGEMRLPALVELLKQEAGVEREEVLTGRGNDTAMVEYLKLVLPGVHAPLVADEATDDDVYRAVGGGDIDPVAGSADDASSDEDVAPRPQRSHRLPARLRGD